MADEATDALIPEAPSIEAAAPTEAPAPDPFEKRYNDLRSEFDRKNALLDRATKQGDVEAIRALGFEYDEPEPEPEYNEDPYAADIQATKTELQELKAWKQQQEAEAVAKSIATHVDDLAGKAGVTLSDYDKEIIFGRAAGGESIGPDATEAAFQSHVAYLESLRNSVEEEVSSRPRAPRPVSGSAVEKQPDLDNPQERREWMKAQLGL